MRTYVFDAYGTLFDVHAAIAHHRTVAGPEAERCSEIWRTKQLEYTWTLTLAGRYVDFWTLTERALDYALARVPSVDRSLRPQLLDAYLKLDAFADAVATLADLKKRGGQPRHPFQRLAAHAHRRGRRFRDGWTLRCGAVGRQRPRVQAAAGGLCPRHGEVQHQAGGSRIRLFQPVGRYGRIFLRIWHGMAKSRAHAERV